MESNNQFSLSLQVELLQQTNTPALKVKILEYKSEQLKSSIAYNRTILDDMKHDLFMSSDITQVDDVMNMANQIDRQVNELKKIQQQVKVSMSEHASSF